MSEQEAICAGPKSRYERFIKLDTCNTNDPDIVIDHNVNDLIEEILEEYAEVWRRLAEL